MHLHAISGWHDHVVAGCQYLKTASNGLTRRSVFNNELIFQLAAMAIEKLLVGVCQYHQQMPTDHTLSGLVEALSEVCPLDADLAGMIQRIEAIDDMCSLKPEHRKPPGDLDIQGVLIAGREILGFAKQHVPWDVCDAAAA
jgi:hypothetical protein